MPITMPAGTLMLPLKSRLNTRPSAVIWAETQPRQLRIMNSEQTTSTVRPQR